MDNDNGIYLYCICENKNNLNLDMKGINDSIIYTIKYKDIVGIVNDVNSLIIDPVDENVYRHEEVLSNIMKLTTLIPMSFGNVFKEEKDVKYLLKELAPQVKGLLPLLKDKIEIGLKIFWKPEKIINEIAEENPGLKKRQQLKNFYNQINIGKEISIFIENKKQSYLEPILNKLKPIAVSYKENRLIGDKMILNASFLIEKNEEEKFDKAVEKLYKKFNETLKFNYTGPWPPYNFVNIKIEIK